MLNKFCPDLVLDSIYDLKPEYLKELGIKGVITDLDNTLVAWNDCNLEDCLKDWFESFKKAGFKICILSNNSSSRVEEFANKVGLPFVSKAIKPRRTGFRRALEHLGMQTEEVAVIGDQILTDILGGNRTGLFTVLVTPVCQKEFIGTKVIRQFEKIILKKLKKRGLLSY